jgi:RNA polymerase sigma-70 factor (ECF subfamily)
MRTFDPDSGWVPAWVTPLLSPPGKVVSLPEPPRELQLGVLQAEDVPEAEPVPACVALPAAGQLPRRWFDEHFDRLWRLVARLGVPRHSVDDVVQEVFITASRRHADIRAGQERRFLIGTAVRVSANYRTRACVRHEVPQGDWLDQARSSAPSAEQLLIEKRAREQLEQVLDCLPEQQRSVFVLFELEGFSVAEIAELLDLPSGTAASRLGRARARFSQVVAAWSRGEAAQKESS